MPGSGTRSAIQTSMYASTIRARASGEQVAAEQLSRGDLGTDAPRRSRASRGCPVVYSEARASSSAAQNAAKSEAPVAARSTSYAARRRATRSSPGTPTSVSWRSKRTARTRRTQIPPTKRPGLSVPRGSNCAFSARIGAERARRRRPRRRGGSRSPRAPARSRARRRATTSSRLARARPSAISRLTLLIQAWRPSGRRRCPSPPAPRLEAAPRLGMARWPARPRRPERRGSARSPSPRGRRRRRQGAVTRRQKSSLADESRTSSVVPPRRGRAWPGRRSAGG